MAAKQQLGQLKMCLMMANSSSIIRSSVYMVKVSVESIITIKRKEAARINKESWMTQRLCQEEIDQSCRGQISGWSSGCIPGR